MFLRNANKSGPKAFSQHSIKMQIHYYNFGVWHLFLKSFQILVMFSFILKYNFIGEFYVRYLCIEIW